ncbi:putative TetR family transcriptional regulator [Cupriavidus basilensis OR16]|uniref:Putative TetR family transcriptional regulator n=1 Tax=Cupriavidus basilensis OR16 TaxID=1127483 RepID=H1SIL6_9BURK|nr:putative TetR family transcriptional regulator [Cupriavidus basilensis OR16]
MTSEITAPSEAAGTTLRAALKQPRQERSEATLKALLAAGRTLINEAGSLGGFSLSDLVRAASTSVGAFYARFPDKETFCALVLEDTLAELWMQWCRALPAMLPLDVSPVRMRNPYRGPARHQRVDHHRAAYAQRAGFVRPAAGAAADRDAAPLPCPACGGRRLAYASGSIRYRFIIRIRWVSSLRSSRCSGPGSLSNRLASVPTRN